MKKVLIAISTFKKVPALLELLESLEKHGYNGVADILITDDDEGSAKDSVPPGYLYTTGKNLGIAKNKNRAIKYFLENPQYEELVLMDDDIIFHSPGLLDACRETKHAHVTGYLGSWEEGVGVTGEDLRPQLSGNPYFKDFPIKGGPENGLVYRFGSQGGMLYFKRSVVERTKYFHVPPGKYGYEHSIYSNVVNRVLGFFIDWFPILHTSPKYFRDNGKFPNNYEANPQENNLWWNEMRVKIQRGIDFINLKHQVPEGEKVERITSE